MPGVIVFDVDGTLLDLRALNPLFARAFGEAAVMSEWFSQVLRSALVATITGAYRDFEEIQREALEVMARRYERELSEQQRADIVAGMRGLPPYPEVRESLTRLPAAYSKRVSYWRL